MMETTSSNKETDGSKKETINAKDETQKPYQIHIGKTLRKLMQHKNISTAKLGKMIGRDKSAVSKMLLKPYLHSKVMLDISKALKHDLFQYLYQPGEWPANKQLLQENEQLKKEMQILIKENEYLKKINGLMEKNTGEQS
jgi:predicted transcriptional regulator